LAWFVLDAIEQLDLTAIRGRYRADGHGAPNQALVGTRWITDHAEGSTLTPTNTRHSPIQKAAASRDWADAGRHHDALMVW